MCTAGCNSCTGPTLNNCQTCTNVTTGGITTIYYKHQTLNSCVTSCVAGFFGYDLINKCSPCDGGCVTCSNSSSNCFSCRPFNGNDYYKVMNANSCMMACPDGTYGDPTNYSCIPCPYFTYLGQCLLICPNETNVDASTGKIICKNCSTTDNTCQDKH